MKYAYPEGEVHDIVLSVKLTDNRLMFKLIDTGKPFDPTIVPDADVNLSAEERQIGGLGIFLVRQIMDSVEYRRIDGKNILTMIKLL
jgi:sigma-B regulation protein RsbU (phosphoserine phosphatase)